MKKNLLGIGMMLLLFNSEISFAQTRTISGVVLSGEDTLPLPGVNITVVGANRGTITSIDEDYSIQGTNDDVMQFSFIGFTTAERTVGSKNIIEVTLKG